MSIQKKGVSPVSAPAIFESKLASSGLTLNDAEALGIKFLADCSKKHGHFMPIQGMVLPYHDLSGKPTSFYRIRYLEKPKGFAGQVAKPQRYVQEAGSLNEVYCPPIIKWDEVANNPTIDIYITEGELKAACAAKHGLVCMALGGVNTWSSSKRNIDLLEPLPKIDWKNRRVTIIFDSDAAINPNVAKAQIMLANKLISLGAIAVIASLPMTSSGEKQGLDDFLVAGGDIQEVLKAAQSIRLGERLAELNTMFSYVQDQDVIINMATGKRMKRDAFANGCQANNIIQDIVQSSNGTLRKVELKVAQEWLKWPARTDVRTLTYKPGQPQLVAGEFNLWQGWGTAPKPGTIQPWVELLDHLFGNDHETRLWFERWVAYPIQNPGAKLFTSFVIWGPETGTGKSLVGYTIGAIYGENFTEIGNMELHSTFNEWAVNRQFVMGDEITGSDRRSEADKLKAMITQKQLRINMKNLPTYAVPDCINYYFTSNHPAAFFLDDYDRRFVVHRTAQKKPESEDFYKRYIVWKDNGGVEALFDYFLHLDLGDFNPAGRALTTSSKLELIDHGRSDLNSWAAFFLENLDIELARLGEYLGIDPDDLDLVLNKHLKWLYDPHDSKRVTPTGLGREMSRLGAKTLPQQLRTETFGKQRFYVLRNEDKWLNAKPEVVREHIDRVFRNSEILSKAASKF